MKHEVVREAAWHPEQTGLRPERANASFPELTHRLEPLIALSGQIHRSCPY